jgi:cytoskeletal protein RodZ
VFAIGASLREARVKRDLAPADVQKALRIRERYLQALEDEQWQLLPGDAYTKGFLRSYADFLGLDGNLYVDEYIARFRTAEERPVALQSLAHGGRERRRVGLLRPLIAVAVIAAIVAVLVWQLDRSSGTPKRPGTTTTTTTHHHHHAQKRKR